MPLSGGGSVSFQVIVDLVLSTDMVSPCHLVKQQASSLYRPVMCEPVQPGCQPVRADCSQHLFAPNLPLRSCRAHP
eukprot:1151426-Pelagomonas_calceolata.AAC.3